MGGQRENGKHGAHLQGHAGLTHNQTPSCTARPFGAFFHGENEDDKQGRKHKIVFHDCDIFANHKGDYMREDRVLLRL